MSELAKVSRPAAVDVTVLKLPERVQPPTATVTFRCGYFSLSWASWAKLPHTVWVARGSPGG